MTSEARFSLTLSRYIAKRYFGGFLLVLASLRSRCSSVRGFIGIPARVRSGSDEEPMGPRKYSLTEPKSGMQYTRHLDRHVRLSISAGTTGHGMPAGPIKNENPSPEEGRQ